MRLALPPVGSVPNSIHHCVKFLVSLTVHPAHQEALTPTSRWVLEQWIENVVRFCVHDATFAAREKTLRALHRSQTCIRNIVERECEHAPDGAVARSQMQKAVSAVYAHVIRMQRGDAS